MKIVDTNVLLYAVNSASAHHDTAVTWLDEALSGAEVVGFPMVVVLGFVRISTNPRTARHPLSANQALDLVDRWLEQPSATVPVPTARHLPLLRGLLESAGTAGNLVTDAHIATLALEHGATIASYDRDFQRWGVPLEVPAG